MSGDELIGGWPLSELTTMAHVITWRQHGLQVDLDEAHDVALCALVERCLVAAGDAPARRNELYRAGYAALSAANKSEIKFKREPRLEPGKRGEQRPRWAAYWLADVSGGGQFEERVVDAIAVRQVWDALPEFQRRTLAVLVNSGTHAEAAERAGVRPHTWTSRVQRARYVARCLWHAPEAPSRHWARAVLNESGVTE